MNRKKQMAILEFSRLSGINRDNLRFYDRIGLLSPETRGDNGYRYYSRRQLNTAYLITSLRGLGVGLETIKQYSENRTTEKMLKLFEQQDMLIQAEIARLHEMSKIMKIYSEMACEALRHDENAMFLEEKKQEPIFICPIIPDNMNSDEGEIFTYGYANKKGINLGYPLGATIAREKLELREISEVYRYYFKTDNSSNAWKPEGLYAVAYRKCDPWQSKELYQQLLDFIQDKNLVICGDAYEEYPLNDMAFQDIEQYCIRVEIPVRQKKI